MCCGERFTYNDVLEQLFDGDSDIDENVSETEGDPDKNLIRMSALTVLLSLNHKQTLTLT